MARSAILPRPVGGIGRFTQAPERPVDGTRPAGRGSPSMCVRHSTITYQSFRSSAGQSRCGQGLPRPIQPQPLHPHTFVKSQIERASRRHWESRDLPPFTLSLARYDDTRGGLVTSSLAHHRMFVMIVTDTCTVPDVQFPPLSMLTLYTRPSGPQPVSQRNSVGATGSGPAGRVVWWEGKSTQGYRAVLSRRKPRRPWREPGALWPRHADRQVPASRHQLPPRNTRYKPDAGPCGLVTGSGAYAPYQSCTHSQTLPCMSHSPHALAGWVPEGVVPRRATPCCAVPCQAKRAS
jgi:hypothetical protein